MRSKHSSDVSDMKAKLTHPKLSHPKKKVDRQTWVQTDRSAHEAWGRLTIASPRAAALMHHLVAQMDESAAVVASHAALAAITGMSTSTIKRAINDLKKGCWIETVQLGGKGGALAFVVNSRVGWATSRDKLHLAAFTARVLAVGSEQETGYLEAPALHQLPVLSTGEQQLPTGNGEDPPAQPSFEGMEPDLPQMKRLTSA